MSARFAQNVPTGIALLAESPGLTNDEVIKLFVDAGMPYADAVEIFLFLPIAFVRCWLPHLRWHETYVEAFENGVKQMKRFDQTESFLTIMSTVQLYFNAHPQRETVLKIAGRSAEFRVMNELLLHNPQAKPEEIVFSQTIIQR